MGNPTTNGDGQWSQFTSAGLEKFLALNNIKHVKSCLYHPATNGLAERSVQTLKHALRVSKGDGHTLQHRLASFLLNYQNARHSTTEVTPATLMIGRDLRCRLSLLKPGLRDSVFKNVTLDRYFQGLVNKQLGI